MVCLVYLNFVNSLLEGSSSGPKLGIVEAFLQRFIPAQNWGITSQGPLQPFPGLVSTQEFQVTPPHLWAGESTLGWEDLQSYCGRSFQECEELLQLCLQTIYCNLSSAHNNSHAFHIQDTLTDISQKFQLIYSIRFKVHDLVVCITSHHMQGFSGVAALHPEACELKRHLTGTPHAQYTMVVSGQSIQNRHSIQEGEE